MIVGNLVAVSQTDIKRMLAYSSIASAGYILMGVAAGNQTGVYGALFYLVAYLFTNLGAFAVLGAAGIDVRALKGPAVGRLEYPDPSWRAYGDVDLLVPGDEVIFTTAEGSFTYEVTSTEIVSPSEIRVIDQTDGYTATLFACHPKHSTRQRIIIHLAYVGA